LGEPANYNPKPQNILSKTTVHFSRAKWYAVGSFSGKGNRNMADTLGKMEYRYFSFTFSFTCYFGGKACLGLAERVGV